LVSRHLSRAFRLAATLLVCVLLSGCDTGGDASGPGPGRGMMGGPGAGRPVTVVARTVTAQPYVDRFTALGTARANESIEVTSRISSVIERIAFEEGQEVEAGSLLVELDSDEIAANLAVSQASLKKVQSQFNRRENLAATSVISESELEELAADVSIARAEVRAQEARLRNTLIRAPFSGTVGLREISLGDLVGPDTVITTLDDTATMKLEFTVPETYLDALRTGLPVGATTSIYPDEVFAGNIAHIDSRIDPATRAVRVIAELPNPDRILRPGMFLTVAIERDRDSVLLVPEEALMPRQGRQYVYVVEDGKAIEREVALGIRAPGVAEIREGLDSGAVVITEGAQKVRSGMPVNVIGNS
jgi:membrane fusion protein (multidrug efflux system)